MPFKQINRIAGKIGFRLAVWYSALILISMVILFFITYFFLSSTLRARDFQEIQSEISEIKTEFNSGGLERLEGFIHSHLSKRMKGLLFIRLADSGNRTILHFSPHSQEDDYFRLLEQKGLFDDRWITLKTNNLELNFQATHLSPEYILQVGMSSSKRDSILNRFCDLFLIKAIPLIIIGITCGIFLSLRALKPLRHIINTVEAIDIGRLDSRVPRTGAGDELDELARLFNRMLDRIGNLITGMKDSLDNVAHDLRTPLTRLHNISESALNELPAGSPGRKAHVNVLEESERILKILTTLMDISEAETGTMTLNREYVNLHDLVFPIYDLYLMVAETKHIQFKINISPEIAIFADPNKISQVIANLLDNAIKFTPSDGTINVHATQQADRQIITISDNGIGIPEQDIPKIWNRLYRCDQSRSQKGIGLGLSLVKAIINAHQGEIAVSSKRGIGTTFSVVFYSKPASNISKM